MRNTNSQIPLCNGFFFCFRKLKNRVAAQTSRDRKKAKMDDMENTLNLITQQNDKLISECQKLREFNEKLLKENADLRDKMICLPSCQQRKCLAVDCDSANSSPAVSSTNNPQQKGRTTQSASQQLLLQILMACLLLRTSADSTQNLTLKNLKNSPKAYSKISLESLKKLLKEKIQK